ncbi:hypothetical protein Tco_0681437 [Tanacetum coccineum]|uniref:Uncharacterized protein n=1 Tax=Tanacetum coccineum TaxID=301880 RepID=A0ABQ4XPN3_9ASTR
MNPKGCYIQTCLIEILGFLQKFGGGFKQDIDEQDKKKKRSGEDDEEIRICCGLNNEGDEERWKSMALSEKGARSEKNGLRQKDAATPNTQELLLRQKDAATPNTQESSNSNLGN